MLRANYDFANFASRCGSVCYHRVELHAGFIEGKLCSFLVQDSSGFSAASPLVKELLLDSGRLISAGFLEFKLDCENC